MSGILLSIDTSIQKARVTPHIKSRSSSLHSPFNEITKNFKASFIALFIDSLIPFLESIGAKPVSLREMIILWVYVFISDRLIIKNSSIASIGLSFSFMLFLNLLFIDSITLSTISFKSSSFELKYV